MVQATLVVGPGVGVCVEVDERQRAVLGRVSTQDRVGDEVVAAEGHHLGTVGEDLGAVSFDSLDSVGGMAVVDEAVAVVDHGEVGERVEAEGVGVELGKTRRRRPDGAWAETCAGPVRRRHVERDARHDDVGIGDVAGVAAPQERQRTAVSHLGLATVQVLRAECLVTEGFSSRAGDQAPAARRGFGAVTHERSSEGPRSSGLRHTISAAQLSVAGSAM